VTILFPHFRSNLSCQLLAPRTMKIDVPDTVRGELVEPWTALRQAQANEENPIFTVMAEWVINRSHV